MGKNQLAVSSHGPERAHIPWHPRPNVGEILGATDLGTRSVQNCLQPIRVSFSLFHHHNSAGRGPSVGQRDVDCDGVH